MQSMVQEITQWLQQCGKSPVALVAVTAFTLTLAHSSTAQAVDENDLKRLIETNECPGCDLQEADLRRLNLTGANLEGANLREANFFYAILDGANLSGADLRATNFASVRAVAIISDVLDSEGNNLIFPAQFIGADFEGALLNYADFSDALMEEANFQDAYIHKTRFIATDLRFSNFETTYVHDVDLNRANLCGSTYWGGNDYRRDCTVPDTDLEE
ncbi:pentapeptide repeat-containing protein [Leptolyngbya cf. ectocarpi LEGE 11479]|uniref:Pentapeptide repeat-containing protein n=1 Tax=Leptolyngbya cf. ectocarpi LEGE 11479 TaxID=1828722 RepID=A0A928ZPY4_LEPEC|nr:pentapeptide repeat-containing protein [Leptolyngbya ectocarpi]MBE9065695.1 pentapeptide repeat-containing protein [Leptolyngbya cf. ectocarpi LEGE 11479]